MTAERPFYPITLELDFESLDLLIDALTDHEVITLLTPENSPEELHYVRQQVHSLKLALEEAKTQIDGLAYQTETREHWITPDTAIVEALG